MDSKIFKTDFHFFPNKINFRKKNVLFFVCVGSMMAMRVKILTMAQRSKTMGNPKEEMMNPIVKNMDRSTYEGPKSALCIDRLMMSVGITENM